MTARGVTGAGPLSLRIAASLFAVTFAVAHWRHDNLINFLWLSDVALFGAVASLWLGSRLLASMMLLACALPDGVGWTADFLCGLLFGRHPLNATPYMFDPRVPTLIRALSLFHLLLPWLLTWLVHRLGYDRRALGAQAALTAALFWVSYLIADPQRNINWVLGPGRPQTLVPAPVYLVAQMTLFPVLCYLPVHLLLIVLKWDRPR